MPPALFLRLLVRAIRAEHVALVLPCSTRSPWSRARVDMSCSADIHGLDMTSQFDDGSLTSSWAIMVPQLDGDYFR